MQTPTESALFTRLARDNRRMGRRLAQMEFREMITDLENPNLFELRIDFGKDADPPNPFWPNIYGQAQGGQLKQVNVPIGKIAWSEDPSALPIIGMQVGDDPARWTAALIALMKTHHAQPFARFVFLCASLRPIPFFGRFGFAYEYVGSMNAGDIADRLAAKYGAKQVRDLETGNKLS